MVKVRYRSYLLCLVCTSLVLLASGCVSTPPSPQTGNPIASVGPATSGGKVPPAQPSATRPVPTQQPPAPPPLGTALGMDVTPTPLPTLTPYLPPDSSFYATLSFSPTLTIDQFKSLVLQTRMMPMNTVLRLNWPDGQYFPTVPGVWAKDARGEPVIGVPLPGSPGLSDDDLGPYSQGGPGKEVTVLNTSALMDETILSQAISDSRVTLVERSESVTASKAVVARWTQAFDSMRTIKGTASAVLLEDGRTAPLPTPGPGSGSLDRFPISTDELYSIDRTHKDRPLLRFHVVVHSPLGDQVTAYDGKQAYRYSTWLNEVHSPLPETSASDAYLGDDLNDMTYINSLPPRDATYAFMGKKAVDGREMLELVTQAGQNYRNGAPRTRIYLDETSYLPYRIISSSRTPTDRRRYMAIFSNVQVNMPVSDGDFAVQVPPGTQRVYEWVLSSGGFPHYISSADAAKAAGFPFFIPTDASTINISVTNYVEKDGVRYPVLYIDDLGIEEGIYLPKAGYMPYACNFPSPQYTETKFDIDGMPAALCTGQSNALLLQKQGTFILANNIATKDEAIAFARKLLIVPVPK